MNALFVSLLVVAASPAAKVPNKPADAGTAAAAAPSPKAESRFELKDASGKSVGRAELKEVATGVALVVELSGQSAGAHAMHFHDKGKCESPKFESAGPHFNPTAQKHGLLHEHGGHAGDLPNVHVGADGKGKAELFLKGAKLKGAGGLLDSDGSALVIHAKADDYSTDPSGASGDRIACGELKASK